MAQYFLSYIESLFKWFFFIKYCFLDFRVALKKKTIQWRFSWESD